MYKPTLDEIKERKDFYRIYYYRLLRALVASVLVIVALLAAIAFLVVNRPLQSYYATNSVGLIQKLKPLDAPNMSSQALLSPDPPSDSELKQKNMNFLP